MSEALTVSASENDCDRPRQTRLVVGPSGAGKDTLLRLAQAACAEDRNIVFARRAITREASSAEDNEQMSPDAFREAAARGAFAVCWEAHGHAYGCRAVSMTTSVPGERWLPMSRGR